jgi:RND family efflux transporter MFP subunit
LRFNIVFFGYKIPVLYSIWYLIAIFTLPSLVNASSVLTLDRNSQDMIGITQAHKDVDLSMQVRGRITKIFYREGSRVKIGTIILNLDNRLEQLAVDQRRLFLNNRVELRGAKEREQILKKRLETTRQLFMESRSVSGEFLEQKELEYLAAVIERKRLQVVEAQEKIEYEVAKTNLERRMLRAPFEGVITKIFFDEGESIDANQPLVHLVDADTIYFVANLEERIGRQFQLGQKVYLAIQVGDSKQIRDGVIVYVSPVVDPASGLMEVKARFDNQDGVFRPGVGGEIHFKIPDNTESAVRVGG